LGITKVLPTIAEAIETAISFQTAKSQDVEKAIADEFPNRPSKEQAGHCILDFSVGEAEISTIESCEFLVEAQEDPISVGG
jgi:hypothetical protein